MTKRKRKQEPAPTLESEVKPVVEPELQEPGPEVVEPESAAEPKPKSNGMFTWLLIVFLLLILTAVVVWYYMPREVEVIKEVPVEVIREVEKVVEKEVEVTRVVKVEVPITVTVPVTVEAISLTELYTTSMTAFEQSPCTVAISDTGGSKLPEWDGRANGLVSWVEVGECHSATLEFEWWWESTEEWVITDTHTLVLTVGEYNLQKIFYPETGRELNDTLQRVIVPFGGEVMLCEHDTLPRGVCITITCP